MIDLDVLVRPSTPAIVQAAIAQACVPLQRAPWGVEEGIDVIPVRLPDGVWLRLALPVGTIGVGLAESTVGVEAPAALAWLLRRSLPVRAVRQAGATVLLLDIRPGATVWPIEAIGLRWATPVELDGGTIV